VTDWAAFRAEVAMKDVDKQVEDLHAQWDEKIKKNKSLLHRATA
jgi:hypothetical protein